MLPGSVSDSSYVGGLIGKNGGGSSISNSYATGNVNWGASGSVTGSSYVGGLVGKNSSGNGSGNVNATISDSYATGSVNWNASGSVTGSSYVGGLVGKNGGEVTNGYWNTTNNSGLNAWSGGVGGGDSSGTTGLSSSAMVNPANFVGFNFTTTPGASGNNWVIVDADGSLNNAGWATGATFPNAGIRIFDHDQ